METVYKTSNYFNRELSWIEFNARVLSQAQNTENPLFERIKYLSIVSSNFDEFFMVRVATLKKQSLEELDWADCSDLSAKEQLKAISFRVHELFQIQHKLFYDDLLSELKKEGISYVNPKDFTNEEKSYTKAYFREEVFPLLTPLRSETADKIPPIATLKTYVAFLLNPIIEDNILYDIQHSNSDEKPLAFVQIPSMLPRLVWLPGNNETKKFTLLEDLITLYGTQLFPGFIVTQSLVFKALCDAAVSVREDDDDFIQAMEEVLDERKKFRPIRLTCTLTGSDISKILIEKTGLDATEIYSTETPFIDLTVMRDLETMVGYSHLRFPLWKHYYCSSLTPKEPLWEILKQKDVLLHVPYESFEPVLQFVENAAEDDTVLSIKMTLYRTSGNSPLVKSLIKAARKGKHVTAFVELKARFDEERNIGWANKLQQAGVTVIYGIVGLKVHAKMLLVIRKEESGLVRYVHMGTGNYNEKTARLYVDLSLFTTNRDIANDVNMMFNMISGYSTVQTLNKLSMAPVHLKSQLLTMIEREVKNSSKEKPGLIMAKMNNLSHLEVINALYTASCSNVTVLLNIRGICMLIPGVKGMSENIKVISIIDRFLEHSRIYYFQNGGNEEIYLSSSDWMPRNLERRVELMFPILERDIFVSIKEILQKYFTDNQNSFILDEYGRWEKIKDKKSEKLRVQEQLHQLYATKAAIQGYSTKEEFVVRRKKK